MESSDLPIENTPDRFVPSRRENTEEESQLPENHTSDPLNIFPDFVDIPSPDDETASFAFKPAKDPREKIPYAKDPFASEDAAPTDLNDIHLAGNSSQNGRGAPPNITTAEYLTQSLDRNCETPIESFDLPQTAVKRVTSATEKILTIEERLAESKLGLTIERSQEKKPRSPHSSSVSQIIQNRKSDVPISTHHKAHDSEDDTDEHLIISLEEIFGETKPTQNPKIRRRKKPDRVKPQRSNRYAADSTHVKNRTTTKGSPQSKPRSSADKVITNNELDPIFFPPKKQKNPFPYYVYKKNNAALFGLTFKRKKLSHTLIAIGATAGIIAALAGVYFLSGIVKPHSHRKEPIPTFAQLSQNIAVNNYLIQGTLIDNAYHQRMTVDGYLNSLEQKYITVANPAVKFTIFSSPTHEFIRGNPGWWDLHLGTTSPKADTWVDTLAATASYPLHNLQWKSLLDLLNSCSAANPKNTSEQYQKNSTFSCQDHDFTFPANASSVTISSEDKLIGYHYSLTFTPADNAKNLEYHTLIQQTFSQLTLVELTYFITQQRKQTYHCTTRECSFSAQLSYLSSNQQGFKLPLHITVTSVLRDGQIPIHGFCSTRAVTNWNVPTKIQCTIHGLRKKIQKPNAQYSSTIFVNLSPLAQRWAHIIPDAKPNT